MRILGITDQPIDPPSSGGAERVRALFDRLSRRHDVEIVNLVGRRERKGLTRIRPHLVIRKVAALQRTVFFHLESRHIAPAFMTHYAHAALAPLYARIVRRGGWDVVQADGIALGPILRLAPRGTPRVYSSHNVDSEYFAAEIRAFPMRAPIAASLRSMERRMLATVDKILAVSERDRDLFVSRYRVPPEKIVVAPNGYDEETFRPVTALEKRSLRRAMGYSDDERLILFSGSRVTHNEAAVRLLIERVAPRLPDGTRLLIAGSVGDAFPFAASRRVIVTGQVPDVLPYFQAADLAVNPVATGGGTNIKVLQYLAVGLPVISTAFGMRGLEALAQFVQIEPAERFADAIMQPAAPRAAGLEAAIAEWSWAASARKVEACYEDLISAARRDSRGSAA